jgi:hypothetical protein
VKRRFYQWLSDLCHRARDWLDTQGDVFSYRAYKAGPFPVTTEECARLIEVTIKTRLPEIVNNVTTNNALLDHLKKDRK